MSLRSHVIPLRSLINEVNIGTYIYGGVKCTHIHTFHIWEQKQYSWTLSTCQGFRPE
ncbi:hypothetical protein A1F99_119080 [Pyrenophora tritici-repentis]|nr:hypothetical protein A1F99_119080 [Pyrenophora tritici-repentis]